MHLYFAPYSCLEKSFTAQKIAAAAEAEEEWFTAKCESVTAQCKCSENNNTLEKKNHLTIQKERYTKCSLWFLINGGAIRIIVDKILNTLAGAATVFFFVCVLIQSSIPPLAKTILIWCRLSLEITVWPKKSGFFSALLQNLLKKVYFIIFVKIQREIVIQTKSFQKIEVW